MKQFMDGRIEVVVGNITREDLDAIVNAANSSLLGGGGVDGAIHRAGGPEILEECKAYRRDKFHDGLPTGMAVTTTAGRLKARYVIHTVGPVWSGGSIGEDDLLSDCYYNSLKEATAHKCTSIGFPGISTGVYKFPKKRAAGIASSTVKAYLARNETIELVRFVFFTIEDAEIFLNNQKFEA